MIELLDFVNQSKVIGILRGIPKDAVIACCEQLLVSGIKSVEIPLNTPDALSSIELIRSRFEGKLICGAGTVLSVQQVKQVTKAGAQLIISPNFDAQVVNASIDAGMISMPGIATPTEAIAAIQAGANCLKVFPAAQLGVDYLIALKSILPSDIPLFAVGGVTIQAVPEWLAAGAAGVGLGSSLYLSSHSAAQWQQNLSLLATTMEQIKL